jgi:hypothetical protein
MCNAIDDSINNNNFKENVTLEDLASPDGYAAFCQLCSDNGKVPMSYEAWVDILGVEDKSDLKFYNPGVSVGSGLAAAQGFLRSVGISSGTQEQFLRSAGQRLKTEFSRRASATASKIYQKVDTSGDDGGTSEADYIGGTPFNPTGLSLKNKPLDTNFDTDIRFIGADKYFLDGYEKNTPLLMKCGTPGIINTAAGDPQVVAYFKDVICNRFRREIAQKVTYNTRIVELFTNDNIAVYLNNTIQALCIYYFVMSISAYTQDPRNKNQAMDNLANGFSPTDVQNIKILERMVKQSVLPPFLHKFCFYMMGNYKQSHMPGSPLLKVMPWVFAPSSKESLTTFGTKQGLGPIMSAVNGLKFIAQYADVLGKACPEWVDFEPYQYTSSPRFDANYNTFWCNGAYITTQASSVSGEYSMIKFPYSADSAGGITWNSDTDAPDGWVQAMQEITYVDALEDTVAGPGLFSPNVVQLDGSLTSAASTFMIGDDILPLQTTCVVFDNSATDRGFLDVSKHQRYQALAKNTYSTSWLSTTYHSHQKFGSSLIALQDVETIRPSVFSWLDLYVSDFKALSNGSSSQKSFGRKKMSKKFAGSKDNS